VARVITFPGSSPDNTSVSVCDDTVSLGRLFLVRMVRILLRYSDRPPVADDQARARELSGPSGAWYEQAEVQEAALVSQWTLAAC
jgi:hypothetical protein